MTTIADNNHAIKRNSAFLTGLDDMRDSRIFDTTIEHLNALAKIASADDNDKGFDMLHVNFPWKTVSMEDAARLPINILVEGKDNAGMLLWVDGPCADKAIKLLDVWGFKFHSVLHVTSYVNAPTVFSSIDETEHVLASSEEGNKVARKNMVPHGWMVDGIVPSKTRQLWFATKGDNPAAYLKDPSFIRKRLQGSSTFVYSKKVDTAHATLSSKKRNLDSWVVYPEYSAYIPTELTLALESIHKPTARVVSLFGDKLNKQWFTWGPNIPGYVAGPLRADSGFPVIQSLMKYFSAMKNATVQKYMTLVNLYAVQYAKQRGSQGMASKELDEDGQPKSYLTPLVTGRMHDFVTDLARKHDEVGPGIQESPFAAASLVSLNRLHQLPTLPPQCQTQTLLLMSQVISGVLRKSADAIERRKKAIKRKRDVNASDDQSEVKERTSRKFGIAAPVDVSKDLATFMGLADGEQVARTTVVKFVNEYIGKNNLQNPEKKSEIKCDAALRALLKPSENFGPVTYFNLCKLLGPHFTSSGGKRKVSQLPPGVETPGSGTGELPPLSLQQPSRTQSVVGTHA